MSIIVLFDGVCNLCNGVVTWIIPRDPTSQIKFAALQSPAGQRIMQQHNFDSSQTDSVIVVDGDMVFSESDAVLKICQHLCAPWPLLRYLRIIPRAWRNTMYRWVARNRYRWFGRRDHCMLPTPDRIARFIND